MKKKILFVISNSSIGGPQKSLLALLDKIDYDYYSVDLMILNPGGELENEFNKNVRILKTPEIITAATIPSKDTLRHLRVLFTNKEYHMLADVFVGVLKHLFSNKIMNQERQRIWLKHNSKLPNLSGSYDLALGILGLSTYYINDLVNSKKKFHWIRSDTRILNRDERIDKYYYEQLDGFLAVSKETAKIFSDIYPYSRDKMNVFYNYIPESFYEKVPYDNQLMNAENNEIKLLTITRLDPLKGLEFAIGACKRLLNRGHNIKWYILGDGDYRKEIKKEISKNNLEKNFILLGFQKNTLAFIRDADMIVHPSRTEGKSNSVDEAKFVGKPIVVTNYATVKEQIEDNVTGLVAEMNSDSLADNIEKILLNPHLKEQLIKNCLDFQENLLEPNQFFDKLINEGQNDNETY